jgi:hypothetical protein
MDRTAKALQSGQSGLQAALAPLGDLPPFAARREGFSDEERCIGLIYTNSPEDRT